MNRYYVKTSSIRVKRTKRQQHQMCDKEEEVNFVGKAQNWEQRIAVEMESARVSAFLERLVRFF